MDSRGAHGVFLVYAIEQVLSPHPMTCVHTHTSCLACPLDSQRDTFESLQVSCSLTLSIDRTLTLVFILSQTWFTELETYASPVCCFQLSSSPFPY